MRLAFCLTISLFALFAYGSPALEPRASGLCTNGPKITSFNPRICSIPPEQQYQILQQFRGSDFDIYTQQFLPRFKQLLDDPSVPNGGVPVVLNELLARGLLSGASGAVDYYARTLAALVASYSPECRCGLLACNDYLYFGRTECDFFYSGAPAPRQICDKALATCQAFYTPPSLGSFTHCCH